MDLFTSEMQPYHNQRKKLFQGSSDYKRVIFTRKFEYHYQYPRNTLQLYRGIDPKDSLALYSEIGMYAGVMESDWSWAALFADFDNDGWQDLFVSNGFPKDVTDHDFGAYRAFANQLVSQEKLMAAIPEVKVPNFLFKNNGNFTFTNVANEWGLAKPSFSYGAAYGDLDQDGDLDLIVNNIDDVVFLFENNSDVLSPGRHYIQIKLSGAQKNPDGYGSRVTIFSDSSLQVRTLISGRGYLSKSDNNLHFGLGENSIIDSIHVLWPDGALTKLQDVNCDQLLHILYPENSTGAISAATMPANHLFQRVTSSVGLHFRHREIDFIDFNYQRTLPRKFSQQGPSLSAGDVNGDGLEDLFISGSGGMDEVWFIQHSDGSFYQKPVSYKSSADKLEEDAGTLLFDADGDHDLDLYIARGGGQYEVGDPRYQDVLLINDGLGHFNVNEAALPGMSANSACVKPADYDLDGDLDLFVGGGVLPHSYPLWDRSVVLQNTTENGRVNFEDVTSLVAPGLDSAGLVNDAVWADVNGDGRPDLILACEWMPIKIYENQPSGLQLVENIPGLDDKSGWWQSIESFDVDKDGDVDFVAGNYGENNYYRCSGMEPVRVYAKDLDKNGSIDPIISCYWEDSSGIRKEYPYHSFQDIRSQFSGIKKVYNSFGAYGNATMDDIRNEIDFSGALILSATSMKTSWIENKGNGGLEMHALPVQAQFAPITDILPIDINDDGYKDIILVGNDFGLEVQQGRSDAFFGMVLINQSGNGFQPVSIEESHFIVPGDAKSLVALSYGHNQKLIVAGQNNDQLLTFTFANK